MKEQSRIDISTEDLTTIKSILHKIIPNYEVWAFGSRVTGKARKYSDLDLAVISTQPLDFDIYTALKNAFSESTLPFKVDIVDWSNLDENFKKIIKQKFVVITSYKNS